MKKQARERMQVGGGATADGEDAELFSLHNIKSKKVIKECRGEEITREQREEERVLRRRGVKGERG